MDLTITDWHRDQVRHYTQANMDSTVTVVRTGPPPATDPSTLEVTMGAGTPIYSGVARVHRTQDGGSVSIGEGQLQTRQAIITIPAGANGIHEDDVITIVTTVDDELVNQSGRVVGVAAGGSFNEGQQLTAVFILPSRHWSGT